MSDRDTAFPEVGYSTNPNTVPWENAVVWSERAGSGGGRVYEWLEKKDVRSVTWSNGVVSVGIDAQSYLEKHVQYFLINAPFIAVGKNIPVA